MDLETSTLKIFQKVIWCFIVLISLGYMMVWLMMPTNTFFMHWLPDIQAKADPIYFGKQGLLLKIKMVDWSVFIKRFFFSSLILVTICLSVDDIDRTICL